MAIANLCPECGAPLKSGEQSCWLCRAKYAEQSAESQNPYASPRPVVALAAKNQFSLATLFLIMTLSAVALGTLLVAPGIGVFLIVLAVPSLVRAFLAGRRRIERGEAPTWSTKALDFLTSAAIIWAIMIAGLIAFGVVCTATGLPALAVLSREEPALYIGLGSGLAAAAVVATWLLWITRPKSNTTTT